MTFVTIINTIIHFSKHPIFRFMLRDQISNSHYKFSSFRKTSRKTQKSISYHFLDAANTKTRRSVLRCLNSVKKHLEVLYGEKPGEFLEPVASDPFQPQIKLADFQ